jgi:hypothetical protein
VAGCLLLFAILPASGEARGDRVRPVALILHGGGFVVWEKEFLSGEDNMCHSIANLEYHHFKYAAFRRPGDLHAHYFGTGTLSFADGFTAEPGDVFELDCAWFGRPLRNEYRLAAPGPQRNPVRPL